MCFTYVRICITKGKIRINIYFETRPSQSQYDLEYHSVQSLSHATKNHFSQYTHTKHIHIRMGTHFVVSESDGKELLLRGGEKNERYMRSSGSEES